MANRTGKGLIPNRPGERRGGRKPGSRRDLRTLIRDAAEEMGFIQRVPVLDADGKPTGRLTTKYGADGELGYLKWLAENHAASFACPAWRAPLLTEFVPSCACRHGG
jgi:hypothetical protein